MAALAGRARADRAGGHRHRPRGRGPGRARCASLLDPAAGGRTSRPGRRCRTSGCRRAATPSAGGSPCCAGSRTRPRTTRRPGRCRSSSRRSARCSSRRSRAWATWSRSRLRAGDDADLDDVVRRLVDSGYPRVDLVEKRGEFAVRGGILDVFPPTEEHPLRVEFWGDEVEEIRYFKVADQRSLEAAEDGLWAPPCRELLLTAEVTGAGRASWPASTRSWPRCSTSSPRASPSRAWRRSRPVLADEMELLLDLLPGRRRGARLRPGAGPHPRRTTWSRTSQEFLEASWAAAAGGGEAPIDLGAAAFRSLADVRDQPRASSAMPWWTVTPVRPAGRGDWRPDRCASADDDRLPGDVEAGASAGQLATPCAYRGDTERGARRHQGLAGRRLAGRAASPRATARPQRMVEVLARRGHRRPAATSRSTPARAAAVVHVTTGSLEHGFVDPALKLAVLTETDLVRPAGAPPRTCGGCRPGAARRIDPLQLKAGDYVVHEQHGVGRYVEMVQRDRAGRRPASTWCIEYAPPSAASPATGCTCRPTSSTQVTSYVGGEAPDAAPARRRRLGQDQGPGAARRSSEIAARADPAVLRADGLARATPSAPDTPWQRELEDAFPYVETARPARPPSTRSRRDMEQPVPMDRLICGDVGYGKTEIAVRAAFKAVQDGKQVAVLVPTTLLVQQHFVTFAERYASFPVKVQAAVAGSRPTARPTATLEGLRRRHRGRGHRHPPAALRRRPGSRTSAWSSSTRSSGSASSTRSTSSSCAPRSTCWPCRPRRSRARWRWRHRHPGDVHDHHPARGAAPGAHLRRRRTTRSRSPRPSGASCCARARSSSSTTGCESIDQAAARLARAGARGADRASRTGRWASTQLEQIMVDFWEKRVRRAGLHHDRRVRPRHPQRQHPDRRPGRHATACPSCTSCAAGSAGAASAATPTSCTRRRSRSPRPRTSGWPPSPSTPRWARACTSR